MFNNNKNFYTKIFILLFFTTFFTSPSPCQENKDRFSEIHLQENNNSVYFLDAIKNDKVELEKNYYGKDRHKIELDNGKDLKALIEFNVKKDKSSLFYEDTGENLDTKIDFNKKINSFMELNTDIYAYDLNNRSNTPMEISDFNISTEIIPSHKIQFGQTSLARESEETPLAIFETVENRYELDKFESMEDIDIKLIKEKGFLNYSAGAYNLNKTSSSLNRSSLTNDLYRESSIAGGHAAINPLQPFSDIGNLQMGGGYFTNQHAVDDIFNKEDIYSVFTGYKIDRFLIRGEYLRKKTGLSDGQISDSWHLLNKFALTDTLNFTTGFKNYNSTNSTESNVGFEYSFKETPIIKNENLKLEFDASFRSGEEWGGNDSERFGIMTKYNF